MTAVFNEASRTILERGGVVAQAVDLVAIVLLAVLLAEYDLLRVYLAPPASERLKSLGIGIAPLLFAFAIVITSRWLELL